MSVQRLISEGADPNETDGDGTTALHHAAGRGHVEVAHELIRLGAHVDQAEFDGDTPLVHATRAGQLEMVRLLIDAGADSQIESAEGFTPVQLARRGRHRKIVKLLNQMTRLARTQATDVGRPPSSSPRSADIPKSNRRAAKKYQSGYQRRIAAVIGVNAYRHWPRLSGARADAERVASRFEDLGFDEVFVLYDRDATRTAMLDLLGSKLPAAAREDDLVVIFFAGHGQTETVGGDREHKRGYIIPADATIDGVFSTAIPMQKLRELTHRIPAKHVYYAMDSCYSGLGFTRGLSLIQPTADDYINKITTLRSVQMVTAGGEGEEAIEQNGEGVFTRSFLDALAGKADANGDGYVTATEIGAYVAPRVTIETNARQSPQSGRLEGEGEIAFKVEGPR